MKLTKVTITGVDDAVATGDLHTLALQFPFVEFGILCSSSREGKEPRYPSGDYINQLLDYSAVTKFSAHLCGQFSRDATGGAFLWAIDRNDTFHTVKRIQFNGTVTESVIERLALYNKHFPDKQFILQTANFAAAEKMALSCGDYLPEFLFDRSGGHGVELGEFEQPPLSGSWGYAGGFGPDNLQSVLEKITAIPSEQSFWVDMESKVRTNDRLDLNKVRRCLEIAHQFVEPHLRAVRPHGGI